MHNKKIKWNVDHTSNINVANSSFDKKAGFQLTVDSFGDGESKSETFLVNSQALHTVARVR